LNILIDTGVAVLFITMPIGIALNT